jgi:hypothetical protein
MEHLYFLNCSFDVQEVLKLVSANLIDSNWTIWHCIVLFLVLRFFEAQLSKGYFIIKRLKLFFRLLMPRKPAETASRKSFDRPTEHKSKRKTRNKNKNEETKAFRRVPKKKVLSLRSKPPYLAARYKTPEIKMRNYCI